MVKGLRLTEWQIEAIKHTWVLTQSRNECARVAGCSVSAVNRYLALNREALVQIRDSQKPPISDMIESLIERLVISALDKGKHDKASLYQVMIGLGIAIDKLAMVTGKPTSRIEHIVPADKLSIEERRQLIEIRQRLALAQPPEEQAIIEGSFTESPAEDDRSHHLHESDGFEDDVLTVPVYKEVDTKQIKSVPEDASSLDTEP